MINSDKYTSFLNIKRVLAQNSILEAIINAVYVGGEVLRKSILSFRFNDDSFQYYYLFISEKYIYISVSFTKLPKNNRMFLHQVNYYLMLNETFSNFSECKQKTVKI